MTMNAIKSRSEYDSKILLEKKDIEKRKNLLVLIYKHLISIGLTETAISLIDESNINISDYELADNIDLFIILTEYENYFDIKFGKKPVIIKSNNKASGSVNNNPKSSLTKSRKNKLPSLLNNNNGKNSNNNNTNNVNGNNTTTTSNNTNTTQNNKIQKLIKDINNENGNTNNNLKLEITNTTNTVGNNSSNKENSESNNNVLQATFEERKENMLLKPLPDHFFSEELREMANVVRREIIIENINVGFADIVGSESVKKLINEALFYPIKYPDMFTGILEPWKGILLYGPPGTGKTMLAKAVSCQMPSTFFNITASTIVSKWRGDSEKLVKVLFDLARYYQPSTIFLDEIDSIMSSRSGKDEHEGSRRMKTELLMQLDGLSKKENERVFILAASNLPWDLDQALLRRLEKRVFIGFPKLEDRIKLIQKFIPEQYSINIEYDKIANKLEGYSGSDILAVCKEARMKVVRRSILKREEKENEEKAKLSVNPNKNNILKMNNNKTNKNLTNDTLSLPNEIELVNMIDLEETIMQVKPSSVHNEDKYEKWMQSYGAN